MNSNTTKELKPCPFCGGKASFTEWGWATVECHPCGYRLFGEDHNHSSEVVKAKWNARTNTELNKDIVGQLAVVIVERDRLEAQNRAYKSALLTIRDIAAAPPRDVAILSVARKAMLEHNRGDES